jgi:hypothetical protein
VGPGYTGGRRWLTPFETKIRIQKVQKNSNIFKLWPIRKVLSLAQKNEIKSGFEDRKKMNKFLHRNFFIFKMDLELKFRKFFRLEFNIVSSSNFEFG